MGRLDYLIKQGWSRDEAEAYVRELEKGRSPNEAYLAVREPSEVIDVEPVRIIEATESKPLKRKKSYRDEDISDYVQPNEGLGSLIKETYREVKSIPGRKVREAVQDIRVGRVTRQRAREGKIKQRLFSAEERGAEKEELDWQEKLAALKEQRKVGREVQRIRTIGSAKAALRPIRIKSIGQPRRQVNFWSQEGARAVDPMGVFSVPQMQQTQMINSQVRIPSYMSASPDMSYMSNLLRPDGGIPNHTRKTKGKKKHKVRDEWAWLKEV